MLDSPLEVDQQVESSGGQIQLILSARNSWALKRKTHTFGELSRRGQDPPVGETIFALTCKTRSIGRSFENTWERQGGNDFQWASRHIFSLGIPQAHKFPLPWARGHEKKKPEALVYRLVSQPSIFAEESTKCWRCFTLFLTKWHFKTCIHMLFKNLRI